MLSIKYQVLKFESIICNMAVNDYLKVERLKPMHLEHALTCSVQNYLIGFYNFRPDSTMNIF